MGTIQCSTKEDVLLVIKEYKIEFVDIKFTDPFGLWHHLTIPIASFSEKDFRRGIAFDGSSIRGWKAINNSDMLLMPDPRTAFLDPFSETPQLSITCDIIDPLTMQAYDRDPRAIAMKALDCLQASGIGDSASFGPEAEFFIFDEIKYSNGAGYAFYEIDSNEAWWNSGKPEGPNNGYKIPPKRGYFPTSPMDKTVDIRQMMMKVLGQVGILVEKGHHEVGTAGQGEINFRFGGLIETADNVQKYKYVLRNVGTLNEKFVTFLPKPLAGDNGSGMHTHFSIWKDGVNVFAGNAYAGLSDIALFAIGGIIQHAKAIAAFTNPTTNSYHRLVPGFEAPVRLAYSARNRSAAIRIPANNGEPEEQRFEVRFPDPSSNPYLAFSALLMAAIDGIEKKIDPGKALDKDIYEMSDRDLENVPQMPGSLQEAIESLAEDNQFLRRSHVFTPEFMEMWIEAKQKEINEIRLVPHPKEFELYCDV